MNKNYNFTCPYDLNISQDIISSVNNSTNTNIISNDIKYNLTSSKNMFISTYCKEIIAHFSTHSYHQNSNENQEFKKFMIDYKITLVCTMKVVQLIARSVDARIYLHGGPHYQYLVKEDSYLWIKIYTNMIMNQNKKNKFLQKFKKINSPFKIEILDDKIKIWMITKTIDKNNIPFVNIFMLMATKTHVHRTNLQGSLYKPMTEITNYFPTKPVNIGGVSFMKPLKKNSLYKIHNYTFFTPQKRDDWYNMQEKEANELNSRLIHQILNIPDIDNSINKTKCGPIKEIIVLNAETGRNWDLIEIDSNVDVILLNEMDLGMARSDQQHTTRLMAKKWGFNYAWGIEFVELTRGNKKIQKLVGDMHDMIGFTGNAILSRCSLQDVKIFRNGGPLGAYFSKKKSFTNAYGYERRLGGRMGIFAKTEHNYVLGSVHKLKNNYEKIKTFINDSKKIIIGGDQDRNYCKNIGLGAVGTRKKYTWPANCKNFGHTRGDNVCTNLKFSETISKPCLKNIVDIKYSDHAKIHLTSKCY